MLHYQKLLQKHLAFALTLSPPNFIFPFWFFSIFLQTHMLLNVPFTTILTCILLSLHFLSKKNLPIRWLPLCCDYSGFVSFPCFRISVTRVFYSFSTFRKLTSTEMVNIVTTQQCLIVLIIERYSFQIASFSLHHLCLLSPLWLISTQLTTAFIYFSCFTN